MVAFLLLVIIALLAPGLAAIFAVSVGAVIATIVPFIGFGIVVVLLCMLAKKLGITISAIKEKIQTWHIVVLLIALVVVYGWVVLIPNMEICHTCKKIGFRDLGKYVYSIEDDAKLCGDCTLEQNLCEMCGYKYNELYRFWYNYRNEEIVERFLCKNDAEDSDRTCGWPEHGIELYMKK